jgi:hypothetical protein
VLSGTKFIPIMPCRSDFPLGRCQGRLLANLSKDPLRSTHPYLTRRHQRSADTRLKSVIATGMKNGLRFAQYGVDSSAPSSKARRCPCLCSIPVDEPLATCPGLA